jgi:DNA-binding response OmpR family regulator
LELLEYQVELTEIGSEAIISMQKKIPDLVIVGTVLPEGDGIE